MKKIQKRQLTGFVWAKALVMTGSMPFTFILEKKMKELELEHSVSNEIINKVILINY